MKKVIFYYMTVLLISTVFVCCDRNSASKAKYIALEPDITNLKVGETIKVTVKMTDGKGKSVSVDNSKFEWYIVTGEDVISIVPNGNTVKITAKKVVFGNAIIRVGHPKSNFTKSVLVVVGNSKKAIGIEPDGISQMNQLYLSKANEFFTASHLLLLNPVILQ
ncbi:hypothetical protein [Treponema denticola]|uniref:hypothetical protein n=1 Tax=Treponema denticola TaxID=158 RepID=UPI00210629CD|nr:hypothetical protein [Treponema denticola]UTY23458.1 hypothetical protein E4N78_04380 [Treponema denticola]